MEAYAYLQGLVESKGLLGSDWKQTVARVFGDATTLYRDRVHGNVGILELLNSAMAKRRLSRARGAMGADRSFYLRMVLPPPLDSVAYYAGIVQAAYQHPGKRDATALQTVGIEQPIGAVVDDRIEAEFLLYLREKVSVEPTPELYTKSKKLTREWRAYVRQTFADFMCRQGVNVTLSEGCSGK